MDDVRDLVPPEQHGAVAEAAGVPPGDAAKRFDLLLAFVPGLTAAVHLAASAKRIRIALVAADFFEAASAFYGAVGLVLGFMGIPVSVLIGTPFSEFTAPANG